MALLTRILSDARADGRTIHGIVVPYNEVTTVNDGAGPYKEAFAPGAFTRSLDARGDKVRLYTQHNRSRLPLGRATEWVESTEGLRGSFLVPETTEGNDALTLVREGVVDSFSVGFRGLKAETRDGVTVRTEAALHEVSLVADPAYQGARVAGIRSEDLEGLDEFELLDWVAGLDTAARAALAAALAPLDDQHGDGTPPSNSAGPESPQSRNWAAARLHVLKGSR